MRMRLMLLVVWMLVVATPVVAQDDDAPSPWCVSVWYYPTAQYPGAADAIAANLDLIDEVNPFWYTPLPDGSIQAIAGAEDADLLAAWQVAGVTVVPSIFSSISTVITTEAQRAAHVEAIRELVIAWHYDGIDIDYEGFPARTREDFSLFIEALADALHAEGRLLSVTVHAKTDDAGSWEGAAAQDWPRLVAAADTFRIMTYDYTGRDEPPGPISPLPWVLDVLAYAESVTHLHNVRMGLHFYGYSWQRGTPPAQAITWASLNNWIDNFGVEIERDPTDMEAMLDFKVTGLPRQTVYVADLIGLDFKLAAVEEAFPALGGVSIWGIGGEQPGMWDTLRDYTMGCSTSPDRNH